MLRMSIGFRISRLNLPWHYSPSILSGWTTEGPFRLGERMKSRLLVSKGQGRPAFCPFAPSICSQYDFTIESLTSEGDGDMDITPDHAYAEAIDKAMITTNGQPFHIDAIARVMGGDIEADRIRNGLTLRRLVKRGLLAAVPGRIDGAADFPLYYKGWTARGKRLRLQSPAFELLR